MTSIGHLADVGECKIMTVEEGIMNILARF